MGAELGVGVGGAVDVVGGAEVAGGEADREGGALVCGGVADPDAVGVTDGDASALVVGPGDGGRVLPAVTRTVGAGRAGEPGALADAFTPGRAGPPLEAGPPVLA